MENTLSTKKKSKIQEKREDMLSSKKKVKFKKKGRKHANDQGKRKIQEKSKKTRSRPRYRPRKKESFKIFLFFSFINSHPCASVSTLSLFLFLFFCLETMLDHICPFCLFICPFFCHISLSLLSLLFLFLSIYLTHFPLSRH